MKRFLSLFLSIAIVFSSVNIVNAQENVDIKYITVQVEFSDNIGTTEDLQFMAIGNNVYANAEELGTRLGYQVSISDTNVVIANREKSGTVPYGMTVFYYDSTKISHMLFTKMADYEAAFESVKNEKGAWIPLEQSLLLLNSSMLIVDNTILIDMPSKNIIDIYMDILKENQKYLFDWQEDIGLSEENEDTMGKASAVVTMFNGLLDLDGDSWVQFVQSFALDSSSYDAKYGEKLAMLFCTYSDDELEQQVKEMEDLMSHFNGEGALGKAINAIDKDLDEKIDDLLKTSNELKSKIDTNNNESIVAYNKSYQALENACDKADFFSDATELYTKVGKEVSEATSFLDKFYKVAEVVGFASEFQNQDEFAVSALTKFVSDSESQSVMSKAMKESIEDYTTILQTNVAGYSAIRYLEENYDDLIFEATNLVSSLGLPAQLMLIGWDVMSDNIPFYKEGLNNADSYMLFMYANIFQADAIEAYQTLRNATFDDVENITLEKLYEVSQYCYTYLKSCYIARNAALGSLKEETKASVPYLIEYQNSINEEIAGYLVQLKNAEVTNDSKCYGFLPSDNAEYVKKYDGSKLANIIEKADSQKEPVLDSYEESLKNILSESISEPILNFICDDFDNNGVYEGIAFCGECSSEDGSYFGTLYFVTQNGVEVIREEDGYWNSGVVYDFGDKKIIGITRYFTTCGLSYYYEIDGMTFKELEGSGYGEGFQDEDGKMYMTDSQYDAGVDGMGHTWNLYYFYWEDDLKEYGGIEISEEQFLEYDGAETILEKILKDGYEITSIYKRQNNIININCCDEYYNQNVRVLLKDECVQSFPIGEKGFYESGIIKPALIPSIATYENEDNKILDDVIENSRECYYEIENQQNLYTVEEEVNYVRYVSNGVMRKIVLYPDESELRDMTETYYYDENGKLVFAFVYDAQNEFRYYFHEGLIYRYIDNSGKIYDYETGKDPYEVEDAGKISSNGELEKHYYYGD